MLRCSGSQAQPSTFRSGLVGLLGRQDGFRAKRLHVVCHVRSARYVKLLGMMLINPLSEA
jgi:hypothetical protein